MEIQKEITPLSGEDLFIVLNHPNADFVYPVHYHSEYEINLVINTCGKRIVGDSINEFGGLDLVMTGPNLPHAWRGENIEGNHVITIQFHDQLLDFPILNKRLFGPIRELLERSKQGIEFSENVKKDMKEKILELTQMHGFDTALSFFSILYDLAVSRNQHLLTSSSYDISNIVRESKSRRISKACEYIQQHIEDEVNLAAVADLVGMSESAFSHFFKKRTGRTFIDYVNDLRIGKACQMLFDTTHSIAEVCYSCGFNNLSNFIRIFRKKKGSTPSEYREYVQKMLIKF